MLIRCITCSYEYYIHDYEFSSNTKCKKCKSPFLIPVSEFNKQSVIDLSGSRNLTDISQFSNTILLVLAGLLIFIGVIGYPIYRYMQENSLPSNTYFHHVSKFQTLFENIYFTQDKYFQEYNNLIKQANNNKQLRSSQDWINNIKHVLSCAKNENNRLRNISVPKNCLPARKSINHFCDIIDIRIPVLLDYAESFSKDKKYSDQIYEKLVILGKEQYKANSEMINTLNKTGINLID